MTTKMLGKITSAEFGKYPDMPFLFGLQLSFTFDRGYIGDGGKYTFNNSKACKWTREEKMETILEKMEHIDQILEDAKVCYVSQLVNKPVEISIENNSFKGFRILTEVL